MVAALRGLELDDLHVLVIDDNSPDGTGEIADRLAAEDDHVHVLHRRAEGGARPRIPRGLPSSARAGGGARLRDGLRLLARPGDVPRLAAAAADADLVLGSRYVQGGGTRNWGFVRRFISRGGSLYAQVLLQLGVRDLTGGFKCYRREVLETIDLDGISSLGYVFQIETTYRALRAGFRVVEVPITFADREVGGSKMGKWIVLEAIWKVPALRARALLGRARHVRAWPDIASRDTVVSACASSTTRRSRHEVVRGRSPGRRRLLGSLVRPLQGGRAVLADLAEALGGPRRVREAEHRREPDDAPRATASSRSRPRSCSRAARPGRASSAPAPARTTNKPGPHWLEP